MKRTPSVALVCAGTVSRTALVRQVKFREQLGWVKSNSYRVASRIANTIKAGVPVHEYADLDDAALIVIDVAESDVAAVVRDLAFAELNWSSGKTVALYGSHSDASALEPLRAKGSEICTFNRVSSYPNDLFLLEGESDAIKRVRALVLEKGSWTIEMLCGRKRSYVEAACLARQVFPSLVARICDGFRDAGLSSKEGERLTQTMLTGAMKGYFRAGRRVVHADFDWQPFLKSAEGFCSSD